MAKFGAKIRLFYPSEMGIVIIARSVVVVVVVVVFGGGVLESPVSLQSPFYFLP